MSRVVDHPRHVARHFQRNIRTIQRWIRAGMPVLSDGLFDLDEIEVWLKTKAPAQELKARPVELDLLTKPATEDVVKLFSGGVAGLRQGLQTLRRALLVGQYRPSEVLGITFQVLFNLLSEVLHDFEG